MAKFLIICFAVFSVLTVCLQYANGVPLHDLKEDLNLVNDLTQALADSNSCKDDRPDCIWIKENTGGEEGLKEYCDQWKHTTPIQQCRETCKFCSKPPSPPIKPGTAEPETEKPTEKPTKKPSVAPKPTQPSEETLSGFQKTCLEAHNDFRFFHDVHPLKWSSKLSRDARNWANHLAATDRIYHDPTARGKDQGENLYWESPAKRLCDYGEKGEDCFSCEKAVQSWYNEEADYDYGTGQAKTPGKAILHFTQIIWKATRELGMAAAAANNNIVVVARYSPVGNWGGEFIENVPPATNFP